VAYGTPFTGEMAKLGENASAPVAALYLLAQGPENRIDPVGEADAGRGLLGNILSLPRIRSLFIGHFRLRATSSIACRFAGLRLCRMRRVWELIG